MSKPHQSCFPVHLGDILFLQCVLYMLSFHTWSISVWPHAHLPIFISVTSSFFRWELVIGIVFIPYRCIHCIDVDISLILSHITPAIFLQLFHPHGVHLFTSACMCPLVCRVLSRYLNSVTCGSLADCILTLPNAVQFRHMYSVFALGTSIPLFSKFPSTGPVPIKCRGGDVTSP